MTVLQAISATVATCIFGIFVLTVIFFRILRHHGAQMFELGWCEGWDDRENDRYPDTPDPKGKHHASAEESERLVAEFVEAAIAAAPTQEFPAVALPKRTPKVTS